jgi:predicted DNA-binding protein
MQEKKLFSFNIYIDLHKKLKILAAQTDRTIADIINEKMYELFLKDFKNDDSDH